MGKGGGGGEREKKNPESTSTFVGGGSNSVSLAFSSLTRRFDSHNRVSHFLSFSSSPYLPPSFILVGKWKGCKEKK